MGGIISAAGSIGSALLGANAAKAGAASVKEGNDAAIAEQRRQYDISRQDMLPWLNAGRSGVNQLAYLAGITPDTMTKEQLTQGINPALGDYGSLMRNFNINTFQQDPSYDFRLQEGQKALERSAAARGRTFSGANMKALQNYGQQMASQEYQNAYNRYTNDQNNLWNRLAGISGAGQQQSGLLSQIGSNTANNVSALNANSGIAQGQGQVAAANAYAKGLGQLTGLYNQNAGQFADIYGKYMLQRM